MGNNDNFYDVAYNYDAERSAALGKLGVTTVQITGALEMPTATPTTCFDLFNSIDAADMDLFASVCIAHALGAPVETITESYGERYVQPVDINPFLASMAILQAAQAVDAFTLNDFTDANGLVQLWTYNSAWASKLALFADNENKLPIPPAVFNGIVALAAQLYTKRLIGQAGEKVGADEIKYDENQFQADLVLYFGSYKKMAAF